MAVSAKAAPPDPEAIAAGAAGASARPTFNRRVLLLGLVFVVPLVVLLLVNLDRDPHQVASPLVGRPAPGFALRSLDGGEPIALSALRGRPVVVNFWATWCVPCLQEHPLLVEAARVLGNRVQFLGVVYEDGEPEVRSFLARRGSAYPSLLDPEGKTAIAFGVFGVPETFFIDGEGRIAAKHMGPLDAEALGEKLRQAGLLP
jgi:cytochrome c biogenesis protein CcmG, thiol:disulfide interchange protein DsbE